MTLLTLVLAGFRPWEFPPDSIPFQVNRGVRAYVQGKGLDRLYAEDSVAIGSWSPGIGRIDIEEAIWLSPNLVSRWLGYLEAKEKWPVGEREARWDAIRGYLNGRAAIVVRLCAFPKKGNLLTDDEPADRSALSPLRWSVTLDGANAPLPKPKSLLDRNATQWNGAGTEWTVLQCQTDVTSIGRRRSKSYSALLRQSWIQWTPLAPALTPEFESDFESFRYSHGEYLAEWHWVVADFRDGMRPTEQYELRIFSSRRERVATFPIHFGASGSAIRPKAIEKG